MVIKNQLIFTFKIYFLSQKTLIKTLLKDNKISSSAHNLIISYSQSKI